MTARHDIKIIRGDSLSLLVGLAEGFDIDIADWTGRFVLREDQDDALPDIYEKTITLVAEEDPRFPNLAGVADVTMTPLETQELPPYDLVCFFELRNTSSTLVRRLFQGKAEIGD